MPPAQFPNICRWQLPYTSFDGMRRGRWLMYSDTRRSTVFIDLDVWPPNPLATDAEYVSSFDVLPDGRMIVCSMLTKPEAEYAVRVHLPAWPTELTSAPSEVSPTPIPGRNCEVCVVGDRVIAFDPLIERSSPPETKRAYSLEDGRFRSVSELPEVRTFDRGSFAHQTRDNGKVTLADGTDVLIWDGNGYESQKGAFERTWKLAARSSALLGGWTAAPWGEDGFLYLSNRRVQYAQRGASPVPVMLDADNVMYLCSGPEGSIIASHGKNRKALAARVWFPAEGTYIPVARKQLGIAPHCRPDELYWSAATRHVYSKFGGLLTFPESDLLALKRVRPRGGGYKLAPT
jgi:hypothetical protein